MAGGVSCSYLHATKDRSGHPDFAGPPRLMRRFGRQTHSFNVIARRLPALPAGRQAEGRERRGNRSEAELDEVNLFIFRDSDCHIPILSGFAMT
jgi:hypothetical protein